MRILSSSPTVQAFMRLCSRDRRLTMAIQGVSVYESRGAMSIIICPVPGQVRWISGRIFKIALFLRSLGHFTTIVVNGNCRPLTFLMRDLLETCPAIASKAINLHRVLMFEAQYFRALLEHEARRCSAFLLSLEGIYLDVLIHQGTVSKIPPETMKGRPIAQFVGNEAAKTLMTAMRDAYRIAQPRWVAYSITYPDGEVRRYQAELIPVAETESVIALVNRIN